MRGSALNVLSDIEYVVAQLSVVCLIDPGAFRQMHAFVQSSCEGAGRLDVVSLAATEEVPSHASQQQQPQMPPQPSDSQPQQSCASPSSRSFRAQLLSTYM